MMQNFLFTTKDESAPLKAIDFGLSDFIKPGTRGFPLETDLIASCLEA